MWNNDTNDKKGTNDVNPRTGNNEIKVTLIYIYKCKL